MTSPPSPVVTSAADSRPKRRVWDVVLTIVLLAVAVLAGFLALIIELFAAAFTDSCPPATCHIDSAVASLGITWLIVVLVFIACTVFAIIRMVRRRPSWWLGLTALVVVVGGAVVGYFLYSFFVGYT